ncbi:MAG: hypothetical protein GX885_00430 [Methanomicrobiales archaeon]|nr:hypothetical protein [Methanomicrobiales archaeon]
MIDFESTKYISRSIESRYIPPREGGVSSMAKDKKSKSSEKKQEKASEKAKKS